jgi:hypothetical protein
MPDLYSEIGANAKRVLTRSDSTGPETTWLLVYNNNQTWEGGESFTADPELTTSDSENYQAIVECIQTYCEIYEVVRADYGELALKVRANSVPYGTGESALDAGENTPLTAILQAHPDLGGAYVVWNARFRGNSMSYD